MNWQLRTEKPLISGNSFFKSDEIRSNSFVPHPAACCCLYNISPMSQYIRNISELAEKMALFWASSTRCLICFSNDVYSDMFTILSMLLADAMIYNMCIFVYL